MLRKASWLVLTALLVFPAMAEAQTSSDSLAISTAQWETVRVDKGMTARCAAFTNLYGGPQYVSVVEIVPKHHHRPGIGISNTMRTMSSLANDFKAMAAINGSYFNIEKGNSVCFLKVDGTVTDSTTEREFSLRVTGAVAVKKGKLWLLRWNRSIERNYKKKHGTVLASGPLLLENGHYADLSGCDADFVKTRHPRSAIAITKDKRVLLITVDGRAKGNAIGMSLTEMAHLIKMLGAKTALNLDGGGSTMLYLDGRILNHPTDNGRFDHEGERKIPNIIFFR